MKINPESIALKKSHIAAGIAVFATTLIWAALLGMTGIGLNDLLTFKFQFLLEKIFNINTALFFLTFSIPTGIAAAFAKKPGKIVLIITSMIASLLALIVAMAFYSSLQSLWIAILLYIISLPFAIETANTKHEELKRRVTARASWAAAGKMASFVSLGLFLLTMAAILPEHEAYLEKFEGFAHDMARDFVEENNSEKMGEGISETFAEALAQRDALTAKALLEDQSFQNLKEKEDLEVQQFVLGMEARKSFLESNAYKEEIKQQIESQLSPMLSDTTGSALENIDLIESSREMIPAIKVLETILPLGIWLGLMHAIAIAGIFSFIATLLIKTTAIVYALIAKMAISTSEKKTEVSEKKQAGQEQAEKKTARNN